METWLVKTLTAFFLWGIAGVFAKLSVGYVSPKTSFVVQTAGAIAVTLVAFHSIGYKIDMDTRGLLFSFATGVLSFLAVLYFMEAVDIQDISKVAPITGMNPILTSLIGVLVLGEILNLRQGVGIFFALLAIYLFST